MRRFALIALTTLGLTACSDAPTTERVLRQNGYSNITTDGHSWFGCGKDDAFATVFEATSPNGTRVESVVCSGWLKGATIRFN